MLEEELCMFLTADMALLGAEDTVFCRGSTTDGLAR